MPIEVRPATAAEADAVAAVAARTFALACPPDADADNIRAFVEAQLTAERFAQYIADPRRRVAVALAAGAIRGYTMLVFGEPPAEIARQLRGSPSAELSKIYVDPEHHGGGIALALLEDAVAAAADAGRRGVWLGTNAHNVRAQRFYAKHGFTRVGTRRFRLGAGWEDDFVYEHLL